MKYTNAVILFIMTLVFISCSKKTITNETQSKDSSVVMNSNKTKNIPSEESSSNNSFENKTSFKTYCNARYDFCIQYPDILIQQEESENGDGTHFISKDGKIDMSAWGSYTDIDDDYRFAKEDVQITYETKKKSFFVVTGYLKTGKGFYRKTKIVKDSSGMIDHSITFNFEFPMEKKPECAPLIEYIENHF